jgi:hypothetical protein
MVLVFSMESLIGDLYMVQKEEFSNNVLYVRNVHLARNQAYS